MTRPVLQWCKLPCLGSVIEDDMTGTVLVWCAGVLFTGVKLCELCCESPSSTEPTVSIVSDSFSRPASVPPVLIIIAPPSPSPPQQTQTQQSHHRHLGLYRLRLVLSELHSIFSPSVSGIFQYTRNFQASGQQWETFGKKGIFFPLKSLKLP